MKKSWWDSGWWSVVGALVGVVVAPITVLGLLFPASFSDLGSRMARDPAAFSQSTAWVAIFIVTVTDGVLALALWKSVVASRALRSAPTAPAPTLRPASMIFGEVVDGRYMKGTRQLALDVALQNPGDQTLTIHGFKSVAVEFATAQHDVVWAIEATPIEIGPRSGGRVKIVGTFAPNVTHTLAGRQSVVMRAVYLRAAHGGAAVQDVSVHSGSGNSVIGGIVNVTGE